MMAWGLIDRSSMIDEVFTVLIDLKTYDKERGFAAIP